MTADNAYDQMVIETMLGHAGTQRVPSPKLSLFIKRAFLSPVECAEICARIDANREPSTVTDFNGDAAFRTSETCYFDAEDPLIRALDLRIFEFTRLDLSYGEPMQGQRYAVG